MLEADLKCKQHVVLENIILYYRMRKGNKYENYTSRNGEMCVLT